MTGEARFVLGDRYFGRFTRTPGENEAAVREARAALAQAGDRDNTLEAVIELGQSLTIAGHEDEAVTLLSPAVEQARSDGSAPDALGWALLMLATGEHYADLPERAEGHFEESLRIAREVGDAELEHDTLHHLGRFLVDHGRLDEARGRFSACLVIRERLGDPRAEGTRKALDALG